MTPVPIGTRIKSIRQGLGITAERLARDVGISRSYLTLIESGRRSLPQRIVSDLANMLQIPQEALYEMYLEQELQKAGIQDKKSWRLIKRILRMDAKEKKCLLKTINGHRHLLNDKKTQQSPQKSSRPSQKIAG